MQMDDPVSTCDLRTCIAMVGTIEPRARILLGLRRRQEEDGDHLWEMASVQIVFLRLGCDAICHVAFVEIHFVNYVFAFLENSLV